MADQSGATITVSVRCVGGLVFFCFNWIIEGFFAKSGLGITQDKDWSSHNPKIKKDTCYLHSILMCWLLDWVVMARRVLQIWIGFNFPFWWGIRLLEALDSEVHHVLQDPDLHCCRNMARATGWNCAEPDAKDMCTSCGAERCSLLRYVIITQCQCFFLP